MFFDEPCNGLCESVRPRATDAPFCAFNAQLFPSQAMVHPGVTSVGSSMRVHIPASPATAPASVLTSASTGGCGAIHTRSPDVDDDAQRSTSNRSPGAIRAAEPSRIFASLLFNVETLVNAIRTRDSPEAFPDFLSSHPGARPRARPPWRVMLPLSSVRSTGTLTAPETKSAPPPIRGLWRRSAGPASTGSCVRPSDCMMAFMRANNWSAGSRTSDERRTRIRARLNAP